MSAIDGTFDVSGFIDAQPVRGRQYAVTALCALVMFLDGLDTLPRPAD
jgi:MFS transporter, AAHS family, 4-hydroxybenzoate transporter